jgi:hypothetical protein
MKWWQHAISCNIVASVYVVIAELIGAAVTGALTILCFFMFSFPDMDCKTIAWIDDMRSSKHRHWFWHSAIVPNVLVIASCYAGENIFPVSTFCLVIAIHLLGDLKLKKDGKRGPYLIWLRKGKRMSRKNTDAYLIINAVFCIILAVIGMFS